MFPTTINGTPGAPPSARQPALRLQFGLFLLLSLAVLWAYTLYALQRRQGLDIASAEMEMRGLAQVYAENTVSTVQRIDLILVELARSWERQPAEFAAEIIRHEQNLADVAIQVAVADRDGWLRFSNLSHTSERISVADREHFRVHVGASGSRLHISKPVLGRVSGKWSLQFTRPLWRDGRFDGVIILSVTPELFSRFYQDMSMGRHGVALIVRDSGEVMARAPEWRQYIGKTLPDAPYLAPAAPAQGNFQRVARLDGVPRLYGYRKLPQYQLTCVAALPLDAVLGPQNRQRQQILAITALVSAAFVLMGWLILRSVTARERAERAVHQLNAELSMAASVYHSTMDAVMIADVDGRILSVNPSFTAITGYGSAETLGHQPDMLKSGRYPPAFYRAIFNELSEAGQWRGEIWSRRRNGESYLVWITVSMVRDDDGRALRYVSVFHDITDMHARNERIRHLAFHDALTGLPNRALLLDRLGQALSTALRDGRRLGVMFLDLDGFKRINDTLGHESGDHLLQQVASRLVAAVRQSDTVARMGGDEFVVLLEQVEDNAIYAMLAQKLLDALAEPMQLDGALLQVGASIGVASYPEDGDRVAELMSHADAAMYHAKSAGSGTFRFYRAGEAARSGTASSTPAPAASAAPPPADG